MFSIDTRSDAESVPFGPTPGSLSNEDLEGEILSLVGHINATVCRFLDLVAEAESRELHFAWGCKSLAEWLSVRCGICLSTAFEQARVARAVRELPLIHDSFSRGELSYSKVRAMTRVATPANEELLVEYARYATGAQLEKIVGTSRGLREADDPELEDRRLKRRYLSYRFEPDGSLTGSFRLPPEAGATFVAAIEAAMSQLGMEERGSTHPDPSQDDPQDSFAEYQSTDPQDSSAEYQSADPQDSSAEYQSADPQDSSAEYRSSSFVPDDIEDASWRNADEPIGACKADAAVRVAELALARVGEGELVMPKPSVVVHVEQGETTIDRGPHLSERLARRLSCDSNVKVIATQDGLPIDVGRARRVVSPAMSRALKTRDKGCVFPGCHRTRFTHAHHIVHWADGGPTDLANLVTLCSWHHHLLHEGRCSVTRDDEGKLHFAGADGRPLEEGCVRTAGSAFELRRFNKACGLDITPESCVPLGGGESYSLAMAIDALFSFEPGGVIGVKAA